MNLYIVATNHANQLVGYETGAAEEFRKYLAKICVEESIDLLAEELNEEAITLWKATDSVCRLVANQYRLSHVFCDPTAGERKRLGILSYDQLRQNHGYGRALTHIQESRLEQEERNQWPAREAFWLDRILAAGSRNCLFVLGPNHVESFYRLLSSRGLAVEIKSRKWQAHEPS